MSELTPIQDNEIKRRPRVLMLAFLCGPHLGSEHAVGWNRALQAGRFTDTWVICEGRESKAVVEQHLREHGPVPGVHFVFVQLSKIEAMIQKLPGCYYLIYNLWHRRAFAVARRLHEEHGFDIAHHVNIVGYREPGFLWRLPIPFIWGPVGGTQNFPTRFLSILGFRRAALELLRTVLNSIQLRFSRRVRQAARKAAVVLAANSTNQRDLARVCDAQIELSSEVGVTRIVDPIPVKSRSIGKLRILWSGLIESHKALPLLIDALARMPVDLNWELHVLGSGSLYGSCRRRAQRLRIDDRINWLGWRPYSEALEHFAWADVFAFTSLRDTTGTVVIEALSNGVPVVCLDHQGVGDVVTPDCGIKIPVGSPSQVANDLAKALEQLALKPLWRQQLGEGARLRAEDYLWSRKGDLMASVYRRVLAASGSDAEVQERCGPRIDCQHMTSEHVA